MEAQEPRVTDFENYIGDVNLEYGGTFYDLSDLQYGYVPYLEVIDLDSAVGIDNCVLVQRGTAIVDNPSKNLDALKTCGQTWAQLQADIPEQKRRFLRLADAVKSYGYCDPDYYFASLLIWQPFDENDPEPDAESWRAELVKLSDDQDVFDYLYQNGFLSDFS